MLNTYKDIINFFQKSVQINLSTTLQMLISNYYLFIFSLITFIAIFSSSKSLLKFNHLLSYFFLEY